MRALLRWFRADPFDPFCTPDVPRTIADLHRLRG